MKTRTLKSVSIERFNCYSKRFAFSPTSILPFPLDRGEVQISVWPYRIDQLYEKVRENQY